MLLSSLFKLLSYHEAIVCAIKLFGDEPIIELLSHFVVGLLGFYAIRLLVY